MTKLVCKVDGERMVSLESMGKRTLRNGQEIEVSSDQMNEPEIQYLLKAGMLVRTGNSKGQAIEAETRVLLKCTLSPERMLTLDSIKGSVRGGGVIQVDSRNLSNMDIHMCLKNGFLEKLERKEQSENKEEVVEEDVDQIVDPSSGDVVFLDEEKQETFTDVTIDEISESGKIDEQPNSRVGDSMRDMFQRIGSEVFEANSNPKIEEKDEENVKESPKKKGRGRPKKEKSQDKQKASRGRGRPKKEKAVDVSPKPKRKRGRPRNKTVKK